MSLNQTETITSLVRQLLDLHACALVQKRQNKYVEPITSAFTVQQQPGPSSAQCSTAPTQLGVKQPWVPSGVSLNAGHSREESNKGRMTSSPLQHDQHGEFSTHPVTSAFKASNSPAASCKQQGRKGRSPSRGFRQTSPYGLNVEIAASHDRVSPVRTRSPRRDVSTAGKLGSQSPRRRQHSPGISREAVGTAHGDCAGHCKMQYAEALQVAYGPPAQPGHTAHQLSKAHTVSHEHGSMPVHSLPAQNCSLSTSTKSSKHQKNRNDMQQTKDASSSPEPGKAATTTAAASAAAVAVVVAAATAAALMKHQPAAAAPQASAHPASGTALPSAQPALKPAAQSAPSSALAAAQQALKGFTSGYIDGRLAAMRSSSSSSAGSLSRVQPGSVLTAQHGTSSTARSSLCDSLHIDCCGPISSAVAVGAAVAAAGGVLGIRPGNQSGLPATVSPLGLT